MFRCENKIVGHFGCHVVSFFVFYHRVEIVFIPMTLFIDVKLCVFDIYLNRNFETLVLPSNCYISLNSIVVFLYTTCSFELCALI